MMIRVIGKVGIVISLVILVSAGAAWVLSSFVDWSLKYQRTDVRRRSITSCDLGGSAAGIGIYFDRMHYTQVDEAMRESLERDAGLLPKWRFVATERNRIFPPSYGFQFRTQRRLTTLPHCTADNYWLMAGLPYWAVMLASLIPLGWRLKAVVKRRRRVARVASQRCSNCGYDMRASPDRCPECGTAARTAPGAPG